MTHDFDELVGADELSPEERVILRRVHDLIVAAGPAPGFSAAPPRATRRRFDRFHNRIAGAAAAAVLATVAAVGGALFYVLAEDAGRVATRVATPSKPAPSLPRQGVLVHGESLAGVRLGDTAAAVRANWGRNFTVCEGCKPTTWFYLYPTGDPLGAAVTFRNGRVTAVFTLGAPTGWRTDKGLRVGELIPEDHGGAEATWSGCLGYGAKSTRSGDTVTSILTQGLAVYGFALTRPSEPVCR